MSLFKAILEINNDAVYLNGIHIPGVSWKGDTLSWNVHVFTFSTFGHVTFHASRLFFNGVINLGSATENTAKPVFGSTTATTYHTQISEEAESWDDKSQSCSSSNLYSGPDVTVGYEANPSGGAKVILHIGDTDLSLFPVSWSLQPDTNRIQITIPSSSQSVTEAVAKPGMFPIQSVITFTFDALHFSGYIDVADKSGTDESKGHCWLGIAAAPDTTMELKEPILQKSFLQEDKPEEPILQQSFLKEDKPQELTLMRLFALSTAPPNIGKRAQELFVKLMLYAMNASTREDIFHENAPLLDPDEEVVVKRTGASDFYDQFSIAFIGEAFGRHPPDDQSKLSSEEKRKIAYWIERTVLQIPAYHDQTQQVYLLAFTDLVTEMKDYLDDQKKRAGSPPYWAKQLYDYLLSQEQLVNITTRLLFHQTDGMKLLITYSNVLQILDPSNALSSTYVSKVVTSVLLHVGPASVDLKKNETAQQLRKVLTLLVTELSQDKKNAASAGKQINMLISPVKDPANFVQEFVALLASVEVTKFERSSGQSLMKMIGEAVNQYFKNHPELSNNGEQFLLEAKKLMYSMLITAYFNITIIGLSNGKVDPLNTANKVIKSVYWGLAVLRNLETLHEWIASEIASKTQQATTEEIELINLGQAGEEDTASLLTESLGEAVNTEGRIVIRAGSLAAKIFDGLEKVLKVAGPVIAAWNAVMQGIQLAKDVDDGAAISVKVMDSIQLGCSILQGICLTTELVLGEVAEIAGVLSIVFVVVGLLAAIVNYFLPHPTPADKFVVHTLRPWLEKIEEPPADWKPINK